MQPLVTHLPGLQDYEGDLNFTTDAWTSPNNKAMLAFGVHFEHEGVPMSFLLDVVELAESHTGENLARAFQKVLEGYGVQEKVSVCRQGQRLSVTHRASSCLG